MTVERCDRCDYETPPQTYPPTATALLAAHKRSRHAQSRDGADLIRSESM